MERLRQTVKKMNKALGKKGNQREKLERSGGEDGLLQSNIEKGRSKYPSNSIRDDGNQVHAATKRSGNLIQPNRRRYMDDRMMGENAKKLSPEQMAALEIDIFKPLDFYEILFNTLKGSDKGRIISNINEL